jgi:hypothetical protein
MTIVCGDSHTSTHGCIRSARVRHRHDRSRHVLATQCLLQRKPKSFAINVTGKLRPGVTAKDLILHIIGTDWRQRRHRLRARVSRRDDRSVVDGRAHDRVQHVDRSLAHALA